MTESKTLDMEVIQHKIQQESGFVDRLLAEVGRVIVGQKTMVERLLIGLLADGHVLMEGVPGLAKTLTCGALARILLTAEGPRRMGGLAVAVGAAMVVLLGSNLAVREFEVGQPERGVILVEAVSVRSAPTEDDDLTVFELHEGTRARIDQRTEQWAEIVLDDGKVGWIPVAAMEVI